MYNVYKCDSKMYYTGLSLIGAESVEEANEIVKEFESKDISNYLDSGGYSRITQHDLLEGVYSDKKGIIYMGIYYNGDY